MSNLMHYFFQTSSQIKVSYPSHHALQFMSFSIVKKCKFLSSCVSRSDVICADNSRSRRARNGDGREIRSFKLETQSLIWVCFHSGMTMSEFSVFSVLVVTEFYQPPKTPHLIFLKKKTSGLAAQHSKTCGENEAESSTSDACRTSPNSRTTKDGLW